MSLAKTAYEIQRAWANRRWDVGNDEEYSHGTRNPKVASTITTAALSSLNVNRWEGLTEIACRQQKPE